MKSVCIIYSKLWDFEDLIEKVIKLGYEYVNLDDYFSKQFSFSKNDIIKFRGHIKYKSYLLTFLNKLCKDNIFLHVEKNDDHLFDILTKLKQLGFIVIYLNVHLSTMYLKFGEQVFNNTFVQNINKLKSPAIQSHINILNYEDQNSIFRMYCDIKYLVS
jgi:hypothetical protein